MIVNEKLIIYWIVTIESGIKFYSEKNRLSNMKHHIRTIYVPHGKRNAPDILIKIHDSARSS